MLDHWRPFAAGVLAAPVVYLFMLGALLAGEAFTAAPPV